VLKHFPNIDRKTSSLLWSKTHDFDQRRLDVLANLIRELPKILFSQNHFSLPSKNSVFFQNLSGCESPTFPKVGNFWKGHGLMTQ